MTVKFSMQEFFKNFGFQVLLPISYGRKHNKDFKNDTYILLESRMSKILALKLFFTLSKHMLLLLMFFHDRKISNQNHATFP